MMYKTTEDFLKMFGYTSLKELPELPNIKEALGEEDGQVTIGEVVKEAAELENETIDSEGVTDKIEVEKVTE